MRAVTAITIVVVTTVVAIFISFATVRFLLGFGLVGVERDPFGQVRALRPDVREVLAFGSSGQLSQGNITSFAEAMGVSPDTLPARSPATRDLVPIDEIARLNPNPAVHTNEYYPYWISLAYRSHDDRYHQITWYGGEADGLPSPLVWMRSPGWGDFYVRYTVQLSRDTRAAQTPPAAQASVPSDTGVRVDALKWHAYEGLSYDGLEETGFTLLGTLLLGPVLARVGLKLAPRRPEAGGPAA
jgi:hypothetical protein